MTRTEGRAVFAGSVATTDGERSADVKASPATRSATGNLWSGFVPETSSSLSAVDASAAPQSDGPGSQAISMAVLGLGLTGLLGGFLIAAARRQRVRAGRSNGRNER